ncbi:MAG TPA: GNAT family protein [Actinomycetota bacterium]|nr:GNAT family protein [Actinomycetota bacterium]
MRASRVFLREPGPLDRDEFLERVRASRRLHRHWAYPPDTPERYASLLRRAEAPSERVRLICRREDGAIVGVGNLSQIFLGDFRSAYLGYFAFAPFEGNGYMTEGIELVLRTAFDDVGLHRVEANVQPDNGRSIALLERLGFRREGYSPRYLKIGGRWRDHVRYAILAEEFRWRPRAGRRTDGAGRTP